MVHKSGARDDQRAADVSARGRGWEPDDYRLEAGNRGRNAGYPPQPGETAGGPNEEPSEEDDRAFREWHAYGEARGWHGRLLGRLLGRQADRSRGYDDRSPPGRDRYDPEYDDDDIQRAAAQDRNRQRSYNRARD